MKPLSRDIVVRMVIVFVLALALQANTLSGDFTYDDARGVVSNPDLQPSASLSNIFFNDFWG